MRSIIALIILVLSLVGVYTFLVSPIRTWGGPREDYVWDACVYEDYIYVLGGTFNQTGYLHITIFKLDLNGRVVDSWTFDKASVGNSIFIYGDNIYVAGMICTMSGEFGLLIKLSLNFDVIWFKVFMDLSTINSIYVYADRIYFVGINSEISMNYVWVLDIHGNFLWKRSIANVEDLCVYNGGLYVVGVHRTDVEIVYLMHMDLNGEVDWSQEWISGAEVEEEDLVVAKDRIFIIGHINNPSLGSYDVFVVCFDVLGEVVAWNTTWGGKGAEYGYSLVFSDGYIYITGKTTSYEPMGYSDVFILKLDINGKVIWSKTYGSMFSNDVGRSIVAYDGSIFVLGETRNGGENYHDAFAMKIDSNGNFKWHDIRIPKRGFEVFGFYTTLFISIVSFIYLINTRRITYILRKEHDYII